MIFDVKGFGESEEESLGIKIDESKIFKPSDLEVISSIDVNPLIKVEVINRKFNLKKLLRGYGCNMTNSNMYCPFHNDELTGKPSAKYHESTDTLWCFSESKKYSAYHALKLLYGYDTNKIFSDIWLKMTKEERWEISSKYEDRGIEVKKEEEKVSPTWEKYKGVLSLFEQGKVSYKQYKNALYKVIVEVSKEEQEREELNNV